MILIGQKQLWDQAEAIQSKRLEPQGAYTSKATKETGSLLTYTLLGREWTLKSALLQRRRHAQWWF